MVDIGLLYKQKVFTLEAVAKSLQLSNAAASKAMQRWQARGIVLPVRKNLYTIVDLASGAPTANRYEVASLISRTSYVGWHSALEYHGLSHQVFFDLYVGSESRFVPFEFDGTTFVHCSAHLHGEELGVVRSPGNPHVRVTDLERTLVDCFDRIDRAGGVEELMHCLEGLVRIDEGKMVRYLKLYDKDFLYQKAGFFLESVKEHASISDKLLELCRIQGTRHAKRLTNGPDSNRFVKEWRLYVPDSITTPQTGSHDFI